MISHLGLDLMTNFRTLDIARPSECMTSDKKEIPNCQKVN